ncbi:hypothetical protein [Streptomyces sp. NPDC085540]
MSDQGMRRIVAEGFSEIYFQDGGARAMGLSEVENNEASEYRSPFDGEHQ